MKKPTNERKWLSWRRCRKLVLFAILLEAVAGIPKWLRRTVTRWRWPKRTRRLASGEASELQELFTGREGVRQFVHDSVALLHDFLIPHHGNDHRPHALRPRSLLAYTAAAIAIKLVTSGALFLYYPTPARLARIVAQEIVALANQARQAAGLPALRVDPVLATSAQVKGEDMIARDYFAHDSPEGRKPWSWIDRQQYDYVYAGENLAVDFLSAATIHEAFMKSPSHRANVLNGHYQDIGVAVINGELAGHETELLVEFFGTRRTGFGGLAAARRGGPSRAAAAVAMPLQPVPPSAAPVPSPVAVATAPNPAAAPTVAPLREPPGMTVGGTRGEGVPSGAMVPGSAVAGGENEPILVLGAETSANRGLEMLLTFSNFFFVALAVFLTIALLLNIFIRIRVQHPSLILQSIAVLSLLLAMLLTKLHFLERIGHQLRIL